jgi:membrane-bound lytic murein transglycosylase A
VFSRCGAREAGRIVDIVTAGLDCNTVRRAVITSALAFALFGCASTHKPATAPAGSSVNCPAPAAAGRVAEPKDASLPAPAQPLSPQNNLRKAQWSELAAWTEDSPVDAFAAFLRSCFVLKAKPEWQGVCALAATLPATDETMLREFFQTSFSPYAVVNADGSSEGTITGYYEPILHGSRHPSAQYRFPVYGVPDDLLTIDLSEVYPELKNMRLRGRVEGRRVVPYYSRAEIQNGKGVSGRELIFVDDAVDLFFLQIQGSGKVVLDTGETIRLSYAEQNGHPYRSVGRLLVERGELTLDQASMQGIRTWGNRFPEKLPELLNSNASYVFFKEQPGDTPGPMGSLGVVLTPGRSLAVDPRVIPLGAPVLLSTTQPNSPQPLNRLVAAQDTGGAIKGAVRADLYWGSGDEAGAQAGRMRQTGRMWVLLPNGSNLAAAQ